ncbi:RtcB family protein [Paenibacillus sp. TRM 82003]|uniref:RtcB family protein n=1 Tax=Kineococcus sp. TRM81007 TaxID=2925831 RepID=UPI001F560A9F|nr:RtcB family protein [Kineococcus sp. TRM81007]MCI2240236.1 RtcB family protein [Kineococcus sp. TRM81007]MCI3927586.1 RtcB family protein [Paenibacillus sp. TRM 82003]
MEKLDDKLLNWASILDDGTRRQALATASLPFIHPHVALMPDAHLGKGATVGSVIPTEGAIIPAAVGVDIGCGMIAVRTRFTADRLRGKDLAVLRTSIERSVPLSAGAANREVSATAAPRIAELERLEPHRAAFRESLVPRWRLALGSLGSGNHFIEVSVDEGGTVWLFLHSGSRGPGNKLAVHHIAVARERARREGLELPDRDLAHLVEGTQEFHDYLADLYWAQHFALLNREEMMDRVTARLGEFLGEPVQEDERINCHHNYTAREEHYGRRVWLSRKGAIDASTGRPGLIPGSMGTASYVVVGRGNRESLNSSPHGAGRVFSRTAARKRFTREQLRDAMSGIEYRDTDAFLDEIPAAYKDVDVVMADAADLVEVRHTLRQVVNVKGD